MKKSGGMNKRAAICRENRPYLRRWARG